VAIDPLKLRPTERVRLLNSTPLGEVLGERQLLRHRSRAGFRISDDRHVDLFRYVAWLVAVHHEPRAEPDGDPYESLKERARARNAAMSLAGRDIGELPAVVNPERKARAANDFRFFCEVYFRFTFHLAWSPDHLKVISKIERAVRHVVFDTNYWNSLVHARVVVATGDPGCLSLFGDSPVLHRLFSDHITAEYCVRTEGRGRTVDEWKLRAAAVDNHWLDGLVGCAVAASIQATILPGTDHRSVLKRSRMKLSDVRRSKR